MKTQTERVRRLPAHAVLGQHQYSRHRHGRPHVARRLRSIPDFASGTCQRDRPAVLSSAGGRRHSGKAGLKTGLVAAGSIRPRMGNGPRGQHRLVRVLRTSGHIVKRYVPRSADDRPVHRTGIVCVGMSGRPAGGRRPVE